MKQPSLRHLILLCCLLCSLAVESQSAVGSWRSHLAYHNATQCVTVGDKVYVVSDGSLYSYSPEDEFVENYDKANILSDQGIRHIAADESSGTLVIIYDNANIDLIASDGTLTNITDYANKVTLDPTVNDLRIIGNNAYLATNFGLTVLNVARQEFGGTYMLGKTTYSCVELHGIIYAATAEGIYSGNTKNNLQDISNWQKLNNEVYTQLTTFNGALIALKAKESVYRINPSTSCILQKINSS